MTTTKQNYGLFVQGNQLGYKGSDPAPEKPAQHSTDMILCDRCGRNVYTGRWDHHRTWCPTREEVMSRNELEAELERVKAELFDATLKLGQERECNSELLAALKGNKYAFAELRPLVKYGHIHICDKATRLTEAAIAKVEGKQ